MSAPLSKNDITAAAASLGLDPCAVRAVVEVESRGSGFLPSGRPRILFEGHIFWRELKKRGIDPYGIHEPDILFPKWDRSKYRGGENEWPRLERAMAINREAALCSASWGLFQIMGFNHAACGFPTAEAFVAAQRESEVRQLESFCAFMRSEGLVLFLVGRDWAGFALRYNGAAYGENKYDSKLAAAYQRCKAGRPS